MRFYDVASVLMRLSYRVLGNGHGLHVATSQCFHSDGLCLLVTRVCTSGSVFKTILKGLNTKNIDSIFRRIVFFNPSDFLFNPSTVHVGIV